jgi:hypothetical protein
MRLAVVRNASIAHHHQSIRMKRNSYFGLIFSVDANITAIEVVTEEEWMAAVSPIPLNNDK